MISLNERWTRMDEDAGRGSHRVDELSKIAQEHQLEIDRIKSRILDIFDILKEIRATMQEKTTSKILALPPTKVKKRRKARHK